MTMAAPVLLLFCLSLWCLFFIFLGWCDKGPVISADIWNAFLMCLCLSSFSSQRLLLNSSRHLSLCSWRNFNFHPEGFVNQINQFELTKPAEWKVERLQEQRKISLDDWESTAAYTVYIFCSIFVGTIWTWWCRVLMKNNLCSSWRFECKSRYCSDCEFLVYLRAETSVFLNAHIVQKRPFAMFYILSNINVMLLSTELMCSVKASISWVCSTLDALVQ